MDDKTYRRVFEKRGITREVAEERPHVPYRKGDVATVLAADPTWEKDRAHAQRIIRQSSGIAMLRWSVPDLQPAADDIIEHLTVKRPIMAELRPDNAILLADPFHRHPTLPLSEGEFAFFRRAERDLTYKEQSVKKLLAGWEPTSLRDHLEKPLESLAKKNWDEALRVFNETHLAPGKKHRHVHEAKYVFPRGANGKRIDCHPMVRDMLEKPPQDRVFFALEGCLKADALLSAGEAVLSVPSITMWRTHDLKPVVRRYLARGGLRVFVVPDSDIWNVDVMYQSLRLTQQLRSLGVDAHFVAPPSKGRSKDGVDDFLADGGKVNDLTIVEHSLPLGFEERLKAQAKAAKPYQSTPPVSDNALIAVLKWRALHATREGRLSPKKNVIMQDTGLKKDKVDRAQRALHVDLGLLNREGGITYRFDEELGHPVAVVPNELIVAKSFRPIVHTDRTIGDM